MTETLILERPQDYSDVARLRGQQVLFYQQFGSYQGEWFLFALGESEYLVYTGWYGSCSGCDDIQSTWDSSYSERHDAPDAGKLTEWLEQYRAFAEIPRDTAARLAVSGRLIETFPHNTRDYTSSNDVEFEQVAPECELLVKLEEDLLVTVQDALGSRNQESRRRAIEKIGIDEFMGEVGATELHRDGLDRLMRFGEDRDAEVYLWLRDASTERQYVLRVPPNMERVRQAKAWSFQIPEGQYAPLIET